MFNVYILHLYIVKSTSQITSIHADINKNNFWLALLGSQRSDVLYVTHLLTRILEGEIELWCELQHT